MVSPQKLIYNNVEINVFLNTFDVILDVAFDSDSGEISSFLNRSAIASESYDGRYKNTHRYKYDELFSPKFTIVKKDFSDFSQSEIRKVLKYLTQTDRPALLEVSYDKDNETIVDEDRNFCAIGGWTEISAYKIANNRTIGIVATFESVTPYAMSDIKPLDKVISDNNKVFNVDTDDNQLVYPRITIKEKGTVVSIPSDKTFNIYSDMVPNTVYYNGSKYFWKSDESALVTGSTEPDYGWPKEIRDTIYSTNDEIKDKTVYYYTSDQKYRWIDPYTFKESTSDPKLTTTSVRIINRYYDLSDSGTETMVIKNNGPTEDIIVDGANKVISSSSVKRIFGNDFDWNWLPLHNGKNELTVEGNCEVMIEWREVRKIGEY